MCPRVPRAGFLSFAPFFFYAASDAGFSLSGAPHVRAANTSSIASISSIFRYSVSGQDLPDFPEKTQKIPSPSCICPKFIVSLYKISWHLWQSNDSRSLRMNDVKRGLDPKTTKILCNKLFLQPLLMRFAESLMAGVTAISISPRKQAKHSTVSELKRTNGWRSHWINRFWCRQVKRFIYGSYPGTIPTVSRRAKRSWRSERWT